LELENQHEAWDFYNTHCLGVLNSKSSFSCMFFEIFHHEPLHRTRELDLHPHQRTLILFSCKQTERLIYADRFQFVAGCFPVWYRHCSYLNSVETNHSLTRKSPFCDSIQLFSNKISTTNKNINNERKSLICLLLE